MGQSRFSGPIKSTGGFQVGAVGTDTTAISSTGQIYQQGTAITATAAELNKTAGVSAGTAAASKALVLGTNKNVDTLVIADGGLKLGSGAGTAVTATAAEINTLASVAAGTVSASKAVVVGASKNVDTLDITTLKIGGTAVTSTATELNTVAGTDRSVKVKKVALAAVDTGGGVFAWQNPESSSIIVERICLDVTTKATAACTLDIGTTATSATTSSDNLLDGVDVGTAAGLFNNIDDKGTNGKTRQKLAAGKWVTASVASGASAGIVGFAYIHYIVI